jgi:hypothetical protein
MYSAGSYAGIMPTFCRSTPDSVRFSVQSANMSISQPYRVIDKASWASSCSTFSDRLILQVGDNVLLMF